MAILYRTAKFKSANILAIAILGSNAKFNSHQYFRLYGIHLTTLDLTLLSILCFQGTEDAESQQGGGRGIDQDLQLISTTRHLCSSHEKVSQLFKGKVLANYLFATYRDYEALREKKVALQREKDKLCQECSQMRREVSIIIINKVLHSEDIILHFCYLFVVINFSVV